MAETSAILHAAPAASAAGWRWRWRWGGVEQPLEDSRTLKLRRSPASEANERAFLFFPDWVFLRGLTLPPEWSKCTAKLPAHRSRPRWNKLLMNCDIWCVCVRACTSGEAGVFAWLHSEGRFHPWGARRFPTYAVFRNHLPANS